MKKIATPLIAAISLIYAGGGLAADDPMAAYYDGAVRVSLADSHFLSIIWYNQDKTVQIFSSQDTLPQGSFALSGHNGKYRLTGAEGAYKICITASNRSDVAGALEEAKNAVDGSTQPVGVSDQEVCSDFTPHKPGDAWTETLADGPFKGKTAQFTLTADRK